MSDLGLQQNLIDPLIWINRKTVKATRHSWACCPHVAEKGLLERLYRCCSPIFIHAGQVTCGECLDSPAQVGPFRSDYALMDDGLFQQRIIDQLYPLNSEMLKAVRSQSK